MAISKAKMLRKLLVVMDTSITGAVYAVVVGFAHLIAVLSNEQWLAHIGLLPIVLLAAGPLSLWSKPTLAGQTFVQMLLEMGRFNVILFGLVVAAAFLLDYPPQSRGVLGTFILLNFTALTVVRAFLRWWYFSVRVEKRENYTKVLVVGSGPRAEFYLKNVMPNSEWGMEVIGCLDPDPAKIGSPCDGTTVIGTIEDIQQIVSTQVVDELVVALPRSRLNDIDDIVATCKEQGIELKVLADFYDVGAEVSLEYQDKVPLLNFRPVVQDENMLLVKRIVDIVLVSLALPVLVPVLLIVGIAVKLTSEGPVFFLQERVGLHKRRFKMIKFRSMYTDAEERLKEIEHLNEAEGPIFKMENDPRVTPIGGFIRRTSLDELPQLINVFKGDMSLVGPRPMSVRDVSLFDRGIQNKRFSVRPGIACLREIHGRSALSFDRWLELDLEYIDTWSLALDFRILLKTIPVVIKGSGAS